MKLLTQVLTPIIILIVSFAFWFILYSCKKGDQNWLIRRITTTCVILLFFVHPTISEYVFNAFKCENFDGEGRLYKDLEVVCYT